MDNPRIKGSTVIQLADLTPAVLVTYHIASLDHESEEIEDDAVEVANELGDLIQETIGNFIARLVSQSES